MPYDVKNSNRRIYTKECAIDIVQQFVELNHKSSVLGQLDFPKNGELALKDVSHRVESMDINEEKKCIEVTIKILEDSPKGNIFKTQLESFGGMKNFNEFFAIRPMGLGWVDEKGEVQDYKFLSCSIIRKHNDPFKDIDNK